MKYIDSVRLQVGKVISHNEYVKDCIFWGSNHILFLALDDAIAYCVEKHEFFNASVYLDHLREYDLPLSFTADFIIELYFDIQALGDIAISDDFYL